MSKTKTRGRVNKKLIDFPDQNLNALGNNGLAGRKDDPRPAVRRGLYAGNLRRLRERAGFRSAAALAREIDSTGANVTKWESGAVGLSPAEALRIAEVIACDPRELYIGSIFSAPPPPPPDSAEPYYGPDAPALPHNQHWWQVSGDAMHLAGIFHGDLVAVGEWQRPMDGGIVMISVSRPDGSTWNTVRMRRGDYFVGHSTNATPIPLPMDDGKVAIRGAVKLLHRFIN